MVKVSDLIIEFIKSKSVKHVFVVSGGASLHLIHSVAKANNIDYICPIHEQAAAMAAESYSRSSKTIGVAFATSGPGATNLATGICGAYFDSIPCIYITGQVSTTRQKGKTGVRQIGFQETDCVSMYKSITKYVYQIKNSYEILYQLEKAYNIAIEGRPGPVVIDVPDNIQREFIDKKKLKIFKKKKIKKNIKKLISKRKINIILNYLKKSKRPVLIFGWGIHLSNAYEDARKLINILGIPTTTTWALAHLLPHNNKHNIGTWGTHGTRYANFAVQNSDLIISIGSRLDTKATGSPINTFAREAKKIVIDIDDFELNKFKKFKLKIDMSIKADAKEFIQFFYKITKKIDKIYYKKWISQINFWKQKYPICPENFYKQPNINPYVFVKKLSNYLSEKEIISVDTGCSIAWMMQAFEFKKNQYLYHDFNNTAMGWAIPASIAMSLANNRKKIISIIGDGSFMLNVQELATISKNNLPIKIFLIDNSGHSMIRQTQDQWLNSKYHASSFMGGLPKVNFTKVANSFGFKTITISKTIQLDQAIKNTINNNKRTICVIKINPNHRVMPQVKFGKPNEDPEPLISRKEFNNQMIVKKI